MPRGVGRPPRVVLDATPLLGQRTGIGRYVEHLLAQLAGDDEFDFAATAFTLRGAGALPAMLPAGITGRSRPIPARLLRKAWRRGNFPPVEWLTGPADIFHATNFVLPPARRALGVLSVHDLVWLTHPETMQSATADLAQLVPGGLARAAAISTLARVTKDRLIREFDLPSERIFVAPPGVDDSWHRAAAPTASRRRELGLPDRYLLFVGTREPRKGLSILLDAYARLREAGGEVPDLVLAGGAGWGDDLTTEARAGVRLAGYVPQADLPDVVAGATALVLPSLDEGFGMTAIEGLAAGVPVVTSDLPVLVEVTGPAALRFPVGDRSALAAALVEAIAGRTPAEAVRREWAKKFTWQYCAEQTKAAYRFALENPPTPTAAERRHANYRPRRSPGLF